MSMVEERSCRNRVKFMCSFGGKILPRSSDGVLKYVGGETRVIAVSPDISFSELMKKLTAITENNDIVLKYQIIPEDLDALVSVKSDEDLKYMMEEYNRHETPKLKTFLFPANPVVLENQLGPIEPQTIEQRYIEAINGILRTPPKSASLLRAPIKTRPSFTVSACSSPNSESSPDGYTHEPPETGFQNNSYQMSRLYPMHKVRSSPNISHQLLQPHNHNHNAYLQPPNYLTCRLPPATPLDFPEAPVGTNHMQPHMTRLSVMASSGAMKTAGSGADQAASLKVLGTTDSASDMLHNSATMCMYIY